MIAMLTFRKAVRDDYWWTAQGQVMIEASTIESIEQVYARTPGGSTSAAYIRVVTKSGQEHCLYAELDEVMKAFNRIAVLASE